MARSRSEPRATIEAGDDADLARAAAGGETAAFEELYRRHAPAAWRVAFAVSRNRDDAADAVSDAFARLFARLPEGPLASGEAPFRPYLLATTRNAAIDGLRRQGRLEPTEDMGSFEADEASESAPAEHVVERLDVDLVAVAFSGLPERWRSVLWLTEVEGIPPREVAPLLGMSANGAAQLAVRARARLRERFLQAHLAAPVPEECRYTTEHLGAYVGGALSPRDVAKVDQHLAGCAECERRREELAEVGTTLRRIALPLPLAVGTAAVAKWTAAWDAANAGARRTSYLAASGADALSKVHRPLIAAAGLTFALGIIGITVVDDSSTRLPRSTRDRATIQARRPAVVEGIFAAAPSAGESSLVAGRDELALARPPIGPRSAPANPSGSGSGSNAPDSGGGGGAPAAPPAKPVLQVSAKTGPGPVGAAVGDACTGLLAGTTVLGCKPPAEAGALLGVKTEGSVLGDNSIKI